MPRGLVGLASIALALSAPADAIALKFGHRTLGPHTRGKDVRVLQRDLTRLKLPTRVDGAYGKLTWKNVRRLERRRDWEVDGVVQRKQARRIKGIISRRRERKLARRRAAAGNYSFPVGDPYNFGGAEARFGAPRSGHVHQGQDIFAPCGTKMYAAQAGVVTARAYQASGAGYYLVIHGTDGTDTVYMHMTKRSWAVVGTPTYPGQQIGHVGETGNAVGCHLHFEHWTAPGWYAGGQPYDPLPELLAWDTYS
ncbi:MAG: peptidoglycan DD-metalloendopeptidase family protein [Solirubrobacterales bacterium]